MFQMFDRFPVSGRFSVVNRLKKISRNTLARISLVLLGAAITGCSPFYVMRAAYEEGKILWRREPISDYLGRADVNQDTQEKLRLVLAVRDYARDVLKLNVGGSYSSYSYVDRPDLTYVVIAAPKTELRPYTWWFPFVGSVPYKGFFSKEDAEAEVKRLHEEGYDANVRASAAFSTLGWFDDPLLSHLLRYNKVTLTDVIFHELFHNTLYIKGASAFNESIANFIGHRAAIDFFRQRDGEASAEYRDAVHAWEQEKQFADFIEGLVITLAELYRRDIPRKDKLRLREQVFNHSKTEWAERIKAGEARRYRSFILQPLNNAVLMHYVTYLQNLKLFEAFYVAEGKNLPRFVAAIREPVKRGKDPFSVVQSLLDDKRRSAANQSPAATP